MKVILKLYSAGELG